MPRADAMLRVLVANSKGGCGKTMLATNLAAAYAHAAAFTVLMDCDPQGSSQSWMAQRSSNFEHLQVQPLVPGERQLGQLWTLRIPPRTQVLVVDAPAGLDGGQLAELVRRCDHLLVPVLPSRLDLAATRDFLERVERLPDRRNGRLRVGLVGNRLKPNTIAARELSEGLRALPYPLVAELREAQAFVHAAAIGRGLAEFDAARCRDQVAGIRRILDWLPALDMVGPKPVACPA